MIDYSTKNIKGYKAHNDALEWEASAYYTLNDAHELIEQLGMQNFLHMLYQEKKGRVLTIAEREAMEVLHNCWNL